MHSFVAATIAIWLWRQLWPIWLQVRNCGCLEFRWVQWFCICSNLLTFFFLRFAYEISKVAFSYKCWVVRFLKLLLITIVEFNYRYQDGRNVFAVVTGFGAKFSLDQSASYFTRWGKLQSDSFQKQRGRTAGRTLATSIKIWAIIELRLRDT